MTAVETSAIEAAPPQKPSVRSTKYRVLECFRCEAPVASSEWSGDVVLRCNGCGLEEERRLELDRPPSTPLSKRDARALEVNLDALLRGQDFTQIDAAQLRSARARSAFYEGEDRSAVEWDCVWMAVWWSRRLSIARSTLGARAALETTLEAVETPAYRGLLLAHLAQHAAAIGATALAKKWLTACTRSGVVEVDAEIRVARAMIAFAKGRLDAAYRQTGDRLAGDGFVGDATFTAIAVNVAAHERAGNQRIANAIWRDLVRKQLATVVAVRMATYGLVSNELARVIRFVRLREAAAHAWLALVALLLVNLFAMERTWMPALFVGVAFAVAAGVIARVTRVARERLGRKNRRLGGVVVTACVVALGAKSLALLTPAAKPLFTIDDLPMLDRPDLLLDAGVEEHDPQ